MTDNYVQYGCGWSAPEGWLNFDSSPTLRFERLPIIGRWYTRNARRFPANVQYGDIIAGLPVAPASCAGIYCSHVLEHLALDDFHLALQNTFRYLKPSGTFRLVLPDLEQLARTYLASNDPAAASHFMENAFLGTRHRARGLRAVATGVLGNSAHLWMWDQKSMTQRLEGVGFRDIRRAAFGDAEDPKFNAVENQGRFDGCLAMQCRKPA